MGGSVCFDMKKIFSICVVLFAPCASVYGQHKYETFENDRFFFSVEYPSDLLKLQPLPENDDGGTFLSTDNEIEMRVWGQYNAMSETLRARYSAALKSFTAKPSYMVLGKSSFVVSGIKNDKIVYIKTLYRKDKDADVFYTLTIQYPQTRRKELDSVVTRVANSFKILPGADI